MRGIMLGLRSFREDYSMKHLISGVGAIGLTAVMGAAAIFAVEREGDLVQLAIVEPPVVVEPEPTPGNSNPAEPVGRDGTPPGKAADRGDGPGASANAPGRNR